MKNKILTYILDFFMLVAITFMGADTISFEYNDVSIRYVQFIFPICFILLCLLRAYNFKHVKIMIPFGISFLLSTIFAINFYDAALYFIWLIYNIFFITFVIASYIKLRGKEKFGALFRVSLFVIVGLLIVQFIGLEYLDFKISFFNNQEYGGILRPSLWFYEPSYLVTFFSFPLAYFAYRLLCNREKKYIFDVVALCMGMLLTTSTTGYVCIIASFIGACGFILFDKNIKLKNKVIIVVSAICAASICIGAVYFFTPDVFERFFMRLIKQDLHTSTGGRTAKYSDMFKAFFDYPVLGVGPNNYHNYYNEGKYFQATNTTLELLATTGALGLLTFVYVVCCLVFYSKNNKETMPLKYGIVMFFAVMQVNQNFMRLYLWAYLGILLGFVFLYPKDKKIETIYINGLFLTQSLTGIQRLCYEFTGRLNKDYKDIKFVILVPKKADINMKNINLEVKRMGLFKGMLWEQISLPLYMLTKRNATLWNLGNDAPILYPGTTMIHDVIFYENEYSKGLWSLKSRIITNLNANRYDKIICPSNTTKNRILSLFPAIDHNEIVVCNPSCDHILEFEDVEFELPVKDYYLSVSSVMKNKNFEYIINLAKIRKNDNFVVIGKKEKIQQMFEYIPSNVFFTGYVPDGALKALYYNCKGFISPSLYEGFGIPPLEAMAFGCEKIYIADIPVYHEVYSNSVMYFDPLNINDLNDKLNGNYLGDNNTRKELLNKYKWANFTSDFLRYNID